MSNRLNSSNHRAPLLTLITWVAVVTALVMVFMNTPSSKEQLEEPNSDSNTQLEES